MIDSPNNSTSDSAQIQDFLLLGYTDLTNLDSFVTDIDLDGKVSFWEPRVDLRPKESQSAICYRTFLFKNCNSNKVLLRVSVYQFFSYIYPLLVAITNKTSIPNSELGNLAPIEILQIPISLRIIGYVSSHFNCGVLPYKAFDIRCAVYNPDSKIAENFSVRCFIKQNKRQERYDIAKIGNLVDVSGIWISQELYRAKPTSLPCLIIEDYKNLSITLTANRSTGNYSTSNGTRTRRLPQGIIAASNVATTNSIILIPKAKY